MSESIMTWMIAIGLPLVLGLAALWERSRDETKDAVMRCLGGAAALVMCAVGIALWVSALLVLLGVVNQETFYRC